MLARENKNTLKKFWYACLHYLKHTCILNRLHLELCGHTMFTKQLGVYF